MSGLCIYEFEDIVWDEYYQSDDHIVPHPGDRQAKEISFQGDSCKRPRCEVTSVSRSYGDKSTAKHLGPEKEREISTSVNRRNIMLEKDSWSRTPNAAFHSPTVSDATKDASSLASDNSKISRHGFNSNNMESNGGEVCPSESTLNDKCAAVDSNSFSYEFGNISQNNNDLNFLEKNPEDEDSSDFFRYDWPEIGNFEDVDRMFRSCDSTFGLGTGKEDELGWFSSDDAIGGSADMLKTDFFCPKGMENVSGNQEPSQVNASYSTNDNTRTTTLLGCKETSWSSEKDGTPSHVTFMNGNSQSDRKEVMPADQEIGQNGKIQFKISTDNCQKTGRNGMLNENKKQPKQQNQSQRKRKEQTENGSVNYVSNLPNEIRPLPSGAASHEAFQSMAVQRQQKALVPDSCHYRQNAFPYLHSDSSHLSEKSSIHATPSAVRSANDNLAFVSPRESSYACSQVQFMEKSDDPSCQVATIAGSGKRENLDNHQSSQSSIHNPVSTEKKAQDAGDKFKNSSDIEGVRMVIPAELCSSTIHDSSSMNSALNDISIEAASFQQLQLVMEQLDLRTKLCIRDSLYRLARNAEQRHNLANSNAVCKDESDASGLMADGSNKCAGFMDMEADTNPVDRSIAHLLFHRPSDLSSTSLNDSFAFKSPSTVRAPIPSLTSMDEKSINNDETIAAEEKGAS